MKVNSALAVVFLIFYFTSAPVHSLAIDNGVEGDPEIECGANGMTVNFNTRNNFEGHVYVKGRFAEQGCRSDEGGRRVAGITLPFTACGTDRARSLNPRGVFVKQNVVISFHPQFLTSVDRAYSVQCFYMEADKTVSQQLEVSGIPTLFHSQAVPMPQCRYDILEGGPSGQPVKFATIGQNVYHKWTCETETTDMFCIVVNSCYVDDGSGNRVNLINEQGCALDKFLLQNLEYSTDMMAGRETMVYKYADKAALFFQCQIAITIKEHSQQCPRPQCSEPGGPSAVSSFGLGAPSASSTASPAPRAFNAALRRGRKLFDSPFRFTRTRRDVHANETPSEPEMDVDQVVALEVDADQVVGIVDVRSPVITALDVDEDTAKFNGRKGGEPLTAGVARISDGTALGAPTTCLSPMAASLLIGLSAASILTTAMLATWAVVRPNRRPKLLQSP